MANIPTKVTDVMTLASADILNALSTEIGGNYAENMPYVYQVGDTLPNGNTATAEDALYSLRGMGNIINSFQPYQNAFCDALVNRIAFTVINSRLYENPLRRLKKGFIADGETIEEIFVGLASIHNYDPDSEGAGLFKNYNPDIKATFHYVNYKKFYPITIKEQELRAAFLSFDGVTRLISRIIESVYTSANYDEYMVMKYLIARHALAGHIHAVTMGNENGIVKDDIKALIKTAKDMRFMSTNFNEQGVPNFCDYDKMVTLLTTNLSTIMDFDVLAYAFHMDKAELIGRQIEVDGFGSFDNARLAEIFADDPYTTFTPFTEAEREALASISALLCNENWFMIYDNYTAMKAAPDNGYNLARNYFYHIWKVFSISPFENAVLFTTQSLNVNDDKTFPIHIDSETGESDFVYPVFEGAEPSPFFHYTVSATVVHGEGMTITANDLSVVGHIENYRPGTDYKFTVTVESEGTTHSWEVECVSE